MAVTSNFLQIHLLYHVGLVFRQDVVDILKDDREALDPMY